MLRKTLRWEVEMITKIEAAIILMLFIVISGP